MVLSIRSSFFVLRSSFFVLRSSFFVLSLALILSGCKQLGKAQFDNLQEGIPTTSENSAMVFAGITSIDQITDTTLRLNWTPHADAVSYNMYNVTSGTAIFLTTVSGQSSSSYTVTGLTPGSLYRFRVRAVDSSSRTDSNILSAPATTTNSTPAPSSLTLISPASASNILDAPTIRISGVKNGDAVRLFTENTCSTQVASGTVSGTTIDLTSSSLAIGTYNFYATTGTSTCSTATLVYTRIACSAGYVLNGGTCILNFAGITSITNATDSTLTLSWTGHASAVTYDIYRMVSGSPIYITTAIAPASSTNITGLTSNTSYTFKVRATDLFGVSDINTATQTATTLSSTPAPTGLTLITPSTASDISDTPAIRVSGVKNGDSVKLFTNNTCSAQAASGTAYGTTIDLTSSSLAVGAYNFYATAGTSSCSTATLSYTRIACSAGYVLSGGVCALSFAGITSIDQVTDTTLRLNWTAHASAVSYNIYYIISGAPTFLTTVSGQSSSSYTVTGLTSGTLYRFRVRAVDALTNIDSNTASLPATTSSLTPAPSSLTLITPSTASDVSDTPTVRISGVKSGDNIKLFTNNTCSTQVASGTATGTTIDLISSSLAVGAYNFYANAGSSSCSTATLSYTRVACSAGYILSGGVCVLNFAGITSVTNKSDSTLTINWTSNASAVAYDIYRMVAGTPSYLSRVSAPATSVSLTGFIPNTSYTFRVRALDSTGTSDINTATQTITTNLAPDVPSGIALQTPSYTPALISTPTIRVSGVKNGDVIKLFTDSLCTAQVASGTAAGSTIDLTTSTLTPAAYTFYANSTNTSTNASACSTATVAYVRNACPANYIAVPFNTSVGTTNDFCVAKYEMKCVGAGCPLSSATIPGATTVATSQAASPPWINITQTNSITACTNLNAINGVSNKYYLISNPEWMTIARNVENVDANWSTGTAGSGVLSRGWTNSGNTAVATTTDASCLYNTAANGCGPTGSSDYKRTLTLSNGEIIWDLSGNVYEWVNWQVTPANKAYIAATPIGTDQGWKEFKDLNTNISASDEMKPSTWQSTFLTATGTEGIGRYYAGTNATGGAALRGGVWGGGANAGAFTLRLYYSSGTAGTDVGFRCVYRP